MNKLFYACLVTPTLYVGGCANTGMSFEGIDVHTPDEDDNVNDIT